MLLVLLLVLTLFLTAGCTIEMALDTVVEVDGSGSVGVRLAADKEMLDLLGSQGGSNDLFQEFENNVPEGWEADSGTDPDGTKWVSARRLFDDPSELASLFEMGSGGPAESLGVNEFNLTQDKGLFSVTTDFKAAWDMESLMSSSGEELPAGVDLGAVSSVFDVQNRLTLPGSIKDNNADEVDGNTLIWRPTLAGTAELYATSVAYRWPVILGIVGGASLLIVGIIVLVVLLVVRPGRGSSPQGTAPIAPQPAPPVPPSPPQTTAPGPETSPVPPAVEPPMSSEPSEEVATATPAAATGPVFVSRPQASTDPAAPAEAAPSVDGPAESKGGSDESAEETLPGEEPEAPEPSS
jgi:hypothetical protein